MTKTDLQGVVNVIAKEFGVPSIRLQFTDRKVGRGLACYVTYRRKIGGKILKQYHPKCITIYAWDEVKDHPSEVAYRVGHELAHHVKNVKSNSLAHTQSFYNLEERIARRLVKLLR